MAAIAHEISTDPKYYESIRLLYSNPSFALNYGRSNFDPVLSSEFGTAYHRLSSKHPYLLAEAIYAARFEMATCPVDVLARRTRLAHTDVRAAHLATPAVASALSVELGWDDDKRLAHIRETYEHLETCGMNLLAKHDCHSAFFKDGLAAFRAAAGPHWSPIERNEAVAILIQVLARHGQLCDGSKNASSGFLSGSSTLGESVGISEYMQVLRRALK